VPTAARVGQLAELLLDYVDTFPNAIERSLSAAREVRCIKVRGVRLESGDEIVLRDARLRVRFVEAMQ
jgi:hypothetical protein